MRITEFSFTKYNKTRSSHGCPKIYYKHQSLSNFHTPTIAQMKVRRRTSKTHSGPRVPDEQLRTLFVSRLCHSRAIDPRCICAYRVCRACIRRRYNACLLLVRCAASIECLFILCARANESRNRPRNKKNQLDEKDDRVRFCARVAVYKARAALIWPGSMFAV